MVSRAARLRPRYLACPLQGDLRDPRRAAVPCFRLASDCPNPVKVYRNLIKVSPRCGDLTLPFFQSCWRPYCAAEEHVQA